MYNRDQEALGRRIYAGVLGKLIGVYLGRPIEGWPYEKIQREFGDVYHYVHQQVGVPLIVADDDISGTFGFFRAMEDWDFPRELSARQIGETWRNYIIEDKTILWWGGLGRSTEHTAYLNLINGIDAPRSGSMAQNGQAAAEQIGAQIFIEGFAMCHPGDPEKAAALVRRAASVSHDGMAVEAACHLAALDALAFEEKDLDRLLDGAYPFVSDERLKKLIGDVRNLCAKNEDWWETRRELDRLYGYHLYPGTCHIAPNHAMVLASILHGGDDFQKSVMIAASAGWDTDCNAGNVGAFNGIRLGLAGIDAGADLRTEVADRLLVITADGGEAVSDAVRETEKILEAACRLRGLPYEAPKARFHFSRPGALQGFGVCPDVSSPALGVQVTGAVPGQGIGIRCQGLGRGLTAAVSTPTFVEFSPKETNYLSAASPTLYESQDITCTLRAEDPAGLQGRLFVVFDDGGARRAVFSQPQDLGPGDNWLRWTVPALGGRAILRAGVALNCGTRFSGEVRLVEMDWANAPRCFFQTGSLMESIWDTQPRQLQMWTSSARHFAADMQHTCCVSHPGDNGLVTLGTRDWADYEVSAILRFDLCRRGGLVLNCRGHRRYYGAALSEEGVEIFRMDRGAREILARVPFRFRSDTPYHLAFRYCRGQLGLTIDGEELLTAEDDAIASGGCGFFVDRGTMLADSFRVVRL